MNLEELIEDWLIENEGSYDYEIEDDLINGLCNYVQEYLPEVDRAEIIEIYKRRSE